MKLTIEQTIGFGCGTGLGPLLLDLSERRALTFFFWAITATLVATGLAILLIRRSFRDRHHAEQDLERFYGLSRDLVCFAGFNGCFTRLNPAWETALGYSREELINQPFLEFVHPDDRAGTAAETERLLRGEEVVAFENRYRARDGSYRWLSWNARSSLPEQTIYATARDITEEKRTQQEIIRLHAALQARAAELEAANRELEAFTYSVSHDLRTPLRHVMAFVSLLRKRTEVSLDEESLHFLRVIHQSTKHMGNLIDDLLVFSRTSRAEMRRRIVRMDEMVKEVIGVFQTEIGARQIAWKTNGLPEVTGDAPLLRQVLVNLIANAVKYTRPREHAEVEVGCIDDPDDFIIFVRDNGVGFEKEYAHKLFNVFQRLHSPEQFEGTGVGLANVRQIVLRHGGRVWADGKVNAGATFYFSLPKHLPETESTSKPSALAPPVEHRLQADRLADMNRTTSV